MGKLTDFFSKVSTNTRGIATSWTSNVNNMFSAMDMFTFNVSLTAMIVVLFIVCGYLAYSYNLMKKQLNSLQDYATKARSLGRVYSAKPFDETLFEKLVMEALEVLRENVDKVSQPYFYAGTLDDIIHVIPGYVKVLRFAKYVYDHPDTKNDAVHKVLVKFYGPNYKRSPQLVYEVTVQINPTYNRSYKHSILVDMSKSQYVYKKNFIRANTLIAQADSTASQK